MWLNRRRRTTEKKCFACGGVGLERPTRRSGDAETWRGGEMEAREILLRKNELPIYVLRVCKVCAGEGVYEVIE